MRFATVIAQCGFLALAALYLVGCGRSQGGGETVHGHVTFRGQPLTSGSVMFFPATGRPISAALASGGEYTIELPAGKYDVVVNISYELPPGWKEGDPMPPQKIVLPAQYTTRAKTALKATVAPDQAQPINFDLK